MGLEWPFTVWIRPLRADVLVSLRRARCRWPPWRRCFGVRQDGRDALLIALVLIGAVEAGERSWSPSWCVL